MSAIRSFLFFLSIAGLLCAGACHQGPSGTSASQTLAPAGDTTATPGDASPPVAPGALRVLQPVLGETPDISNDAAKNLRRMKALYAKLDSIVSAYPDFEHAKKHMTSEQIEMVENEDQYMKSDHLDVGPVGCSWYCGGGPDSIVASSFLAPTGRLDYKAGNIHDFSLRTAWVEGKDSDGVGESITFSFPQNGPPVTTVMLYNGYMKSEKVWEENTRIRQLKLYIDNQPYALLELKDTKAKQIFDIGPHVGQKGPMLLRFEIVSVYPGAKYADAAISELEFDGTGVHCFAAGTLVSTPDGERPIESLQKGEVIWGFDPVTRQMFPCRIEEMAQAKHHNLYLLDFGETRIEATEDHPFCTPAGAVSIVPNSTYGWPTTALQPGQAIICRDREGQLRTLSLRTLRPVRACKMTYTILRLDNGHCFFANGLCVATEATIN